MTEEEKDGEERKKKGNLKKDPSVEDMFIEPFPGDQNQSTGANWQPAIYWVPPLFIGGFSWLVGIRNVFHLILLTLFCSSIVSGLLYYLFFAESDYLAGFFRMFRRR